MDKYDLYKDELNLLLEDENNISFFCDLLRGDSRHKISESRKLIEYVISFCNEHNLNEAKAWMYYYLGWNCSDMSDNENAIEILNEAREIFEKNDNKNGLAYAYNGLTAMYCQCGQYDLANELGIRGILIAKQIKVHDIMLTLLLNTSIVNLQKESYEAAKEILEYLENNYSYSKIDATHEIFYKKTMGETELNIGDPKMAMMYIQESLDTDSKMENSIYSSELHKLKGMAYIKLGIYDEAEKEFSISSKEAEKAGSLFEVCDTYVEWAKFKFLLKENSLGEQYLDKVIELSEKNKFARHLNNACLIMYRHYRQIGDYKNSLAYLELFKKIRNESFNYQSTKLMAKLTVDSGAKEMKLNKLLQNKTELLSNIGQKIISILDIDELFLFVNGEISRLIDANFLGISIYNFETGEITLRKMIDGKIHISKPIKAHTYSSFTSYCIANRKTIVIDDIRKEYKKYVKEINLNDRGTLNPISLVYIPLIVNDDVIGVMTVQSIKPKAYDNNDVNILKVIGNYVAIAIKNALEYKKMQQIAIYDSLTGFLTKREIIKEGNEIRDKYVNSNKTFCIFMIDIDNFKGINDTYGHVVGDQLLKKLTHTISKLIRTSDYIGRYGGDEFLMVCPDMNKKIAIKVAERIRRIIENSVFVISDDIHIKTTVSIGIYEFDKKELSFTDGIENADKSLYKAKEELKNKVRIF